MKTKHPKLGVVLGIKLANCSFTYLYALSEGLFQPHNPALKP